MNRVVIIGGGPGGYEAALVAAQLHARVTVIDSDGIGGSAVLTDCVPSKTLIATAEVMTDMAAASELGVNLHESVADGATTLRVDLARLNARVKKLAADQSADITSRLEREGVRIIKGRGRLDGANTVVATTIDGAEERIHADMVLIATGASPRIVTEAQPDGERILTWEQVYDLMEIPEHLIVVGSGVTGAEFASAYVALGIEVTLVSSRERVLPGEDADAAGVLEQVLTRRGMNLLSESRMQSVTRDGDLVTVTLTDGRTVDRIALHSGRWLDPEHGGSWSRGGRGQARHGRLHQGGPGVPVIDRRCVRRRRLHRRTHAGLGCRDAGADRDVALHG